MSFYEIADNTQKMIIKIFGTFHLFKTLSSKSFKHLAQAKSIMSSACYLYTKQQQQQCYSPNQVTDSSIDANLLIFDGKVNTAKAFRVN